MVRYAVGYQSRAFVTFGAPIPLAGCDADTRARDVMELAHAGARHASARSTRCCRRRCSPRRCGRRSPSAISSSASTRSSTSCARAARQPGRASAAARRSTRRAEPLDDRGIIYVERGGASASASAPCCATTPARIEHLLVPGPPARDGPARTDARQRVQGVLPPRSPAARLLKTLASRYGMRAAAASRAASSPARPSRKRSPRRATVEAAGLTQTLDYLGESVAIDGRSRRGDPRLPAASSTRSPRPASAATCRSS